MTKQGPPGHLVTVTEVVTETADAVSLVLAPAPGDEAAFEYKPGQFLTVRVPSDLTGSVARCYSLASSPHTGEPLKITVKRTAEGYGSNWICDNLKAGDDLVVLPPSGVFSPKSLDERLLLIAGGSGITPVLSILESMLATGSGFATLVYANRDEKSVIFAERLRAIVAEHPDRVTVIHWLESVQGLPSATAFGKLLRPFAGRSTWICGPEPLMRLAEDVLAGFGIESHSVHVERFTSLEGDPFNPSEIHLDTSGPTSTVEVDLDGDVRTLAWPAANTLLEVMLEAGYDAPSSCREGSCSACACYLLEGEVQMDRNEVLDERDLADGLILGCQARPLTADLRVTYEEP